MSFGSPKKFTESPPGLLLIWGGGGGNLKSWVRRNRNMVVVVVVSLVEELLRLHVLEIRPIFVVGDRRVVRLLNFHRLS